MKSALRLRLVLAPAFHSFQKSLRMSSSDATASFRFNHTMYRIKDPKKSLYFYQEVLGMDLIDKRDGSDFSLFFLGYDHSKGAESAEHKKTFRLKREGVLELTHNHGTEDTEGEVYHPGNGSASDGIRGGYGHIAIVVDDIQAACDRFIQMNVPFQKKLTDGKMKNIAFIKDPDGYWVEILEIPNGNKDGTTDTTTYKLNHTMCRVKDAEKSLHFYQNVLGMSLVNSMGGGDFTLYFLAYTGPSGIDSDDGDAKAKQFQREGVLELTHNHGTEKEAAFGYHVGNSSTEGVRGGYGHIAIIVDDAQRACSRFEELGVPFQKRLEDGKMKNIAFIKDPDGYWVEIIPDGLRM